MITPLHEWDPNSQL